MTPHGVFRPLAKWVHGQQLSMFIIICDQGTHDFNGGPTDITVKSVVGIACKRMALAIMMLIFYIQT